MPAKHGYILPEIIDPERICIQLYIPNEQYHLLAFWAQLQGLGSALAWDNDAAHTALPVSEVWRDVYNDARERYLSGEGCGMSEECCNEITTRLEEQIKRFDRIISLMEGGMTVVFNSAGLKPPDEGGGDCAPEYFDHNPGDTEPDAAEQRQKALCITVERYIKSIFLKVLVDMNALGSLITFIEAAFPQEVPLSIADLIVVYPTVFSGLTAFFSAMGSGFDFTPLICAMIEGMSGDKNNTFVNFRNSLKTYTEANPLNEFAALIHSANGVQQNYKAFNKALNDANNEDLDGYECPCEPPIPDYPVLVAMNPIGSFGSVPSAMDAVYTEVDREAGIWHADNTTPTGSGFFVLQFKDLYDRCINVSAISQSGISWWSVDCADVEHSGVGGGGGTLKHAGMDFGVAANTDFTVTLI